ncbi:MAG: VanZ family protein [Algibacter sp.]|uniref:VanZ family protein n=1 Tax=Algibacter sp. TaxID=1872428 RepID=UPI0032998978
MSFFKSSREKHLWFWALVVLIGIFTTLFIGKPLAQFFGNQNVQIIVFLIGILLTGIAIIINAIKIKPSKIELSLWFGIVAVYIMVFLRLGLPERSHLFEYSILTIIIHKALIERKNQGVQIHKPALISFIITFFIGVLDEGIQIILPNRVFDLQDILFNSVAIISAVISKLSINWIRVRSDKSKIKKKKHD